MRRVTHCSKGIYSPLDIVIDKGQRGVPSGATTHQFVTRNAFKIVGTLEGTESRVRGGGLQQNKRRGGEQETRVDADCRDLAARSGTAGASDTNPAIRKAEPKTVAVTSAAKGADSACHWLFLLSSGLLRSGNTSCIFLHAWPSQRICGRAVAVCLPPVPRSLAVSPPAVNPAHIGPPSRPHQ